MNSKLTKNDIAWDRIFNDLDILKHIESYRSFRISAIQIKKYREPRLMTKIDHFSNLPIIFKKNKLTILPITRGDYLIAPMKVYKALTFPDAEKTFQLELPEHLHTLDYNNITSEAIAINCAYVSGILEHFVGEELIPTVNGRMSSETFSFYVESQNDEDPIYVDVNNSQIEIDGGYESLNSLCLIEAKNSLSDDFLIRQLYYPFRLWSKRISKPIRLIFMIFTNGLFHLFEYSFKDEQILNSIALVQYKRYTLDKIDIDLAAITDLFYSTCTQPEPEVPFPQADSFNRIINLCEQLHKNDLSKEYITTNYDFDKRQTDYYINAGRYLGLIEASKNIENGCTLTNKGVKLFKLNLYNRNLKLVEIILEHTVFRDVLSLYFEKAEEPSRTEIVEIMKKEKLYNISSSATYERRASTVLCWIRWIIDLIQV